MPALSPRLLLAVALLIGLARIAVAADAVNGTHFLSDPDANGLCRADGKAWPAREMNGRQILEMDIACHGDATCEWRVVPADISLPRSPVCITEDRP